jgi:hypothetical protein
MDARVKPGHDTAYVACGMHYFTGCTSGWPFSTI